MSLNVELSEEEALCLHGYFERVDETEDLSFRHPAEYLAFQRVAGRIVRASNALLKTRCEGVLELARHTIVRGLALGPVANDDRIVQGPVVVPMSRRLGAPRAGTQIAAPERRSESSLKTRTRQLVAKCMRAFESGEAAQVRPLFAVDARIISPYEGCSTVATFLERVVKVEDGARMTFHDARNNLEGRPQASGYFLFEGWGDRMSKKEDGDRFGVYHYVLNTDSAATAIQSMIIF